MRKKKTRSVYDAENALVAPINGYVDEDDGTEITTEFPTVTEDMPVANTDESMEGGVKVYAASEALSVTKRVPDIDDTRELAGATAEATCTGMEKTQIIHMDDGDEEAAEDNGTQLMLDGFAEESVSEDHQGAEERLRRVRREKIQDFSQKREQHMQEENQTADEVPAERGEVVYPETPLAAAEEEVKEETADRPETVYHKLQTESRKMSAMLFFTSVLEIILFLLSVFSAFSPALAMSAVTYIIIHGVLLLLIAGINFPLLRDGAMWLFSGTPTMASGVVVSVLVSLIHAALQFLDTTAVADGSTPLITAIGGLSVLLLLVGKILEKDRQNRNAALVLSENTDKLAVRRIDDPALAEEIGRPALALGVPRVAYYRKTQAVNGYLKISDDDAVCAGQMKWYLPVVIGASLALALIYFILNGLTSWLTVITLFCSMTAVSAPSLLPLALQLSMNRASHTLSKAGTALFGYQAVEEYGSVHALALDAMDIFPDQSVLLHGIKTFSGTRIDDAILDAASVSVRAGGPLSHVFRRMIQNKVDMLREVDTLVYEQDMGLSGWVNGRRVLIGNRKLLDNHGIAIPSKDYEQRYAVNDRQLVYLSIAGELSAMFVVSYVADPAMKAVLSEVTGQHITLLVRTCDQNVTEQLIAKVFDLNGFYVEVLNAPAGRSFEAQVDGTSESETTGLLSDGRTNGLLLALAMCRRLRKGARVFTGLQVAVAAIVVLLIAYSAFFGGVILPTLYAVEYLLIAAVIAAVSAFFFGKGKLIL